MPDFDDPPSSQLATSHPPSSPSRPCKRPRTSASQPHPTVIVIDDRHDLTRISPNRPPRLPKAPLLPVPIYVPSESEDDDAIHSVLPNVASAARRDLILWEDTDPHAYGKYSLGLGNGSSGVIADEQMSRKECQGSPDETKATAKNDGAAHLPDDYDYPSPPSSSGSTPLHTAGLEPGNMGAVDQGRALEVFRSQRLPTVIESFEPPGFSQDSGCFSFSKQLSAAGKVVNVPRPGDSKESNAEGSQNRSDANIIEDEAIRGDGFPNLRRKYYLRTFEYVLSEVMKRCKAVLRPDDVELVSRMKSEISTNALALFVRLYRRKHNWHRVDKLESAYGLDIDVRKAIVELCEQRLLVSSQYAVKASKQVALLIAREIIASLQSAELRTACGSLPDSEALKKLRTRELLPVLQKYLLRDQIHDAHQKKFKQTTLTGLPPRESLMKAILKAAGHCTKLPDHVLVSLQRIHFLFFLEDGHDSPNIILADTGKTHFPKYQCHPKRTVFQSAIAFEEYEAAVGLERELNAALEEKDYTTAAHLGSIAELEVREHLPYVQNGVSVANRDRDEAIPSTNRPSSQNTRSGSRLSPVTKRIAREQATENLRHPFFRRYTAPWAYARAAWHSVQALERLGEYENAIQRLELLLSTTLIPRRRGKCLNRLTINLFKHVGKLQEPLNIIIDALGGESSNLQLGDQLSLANRGIAIHRKLILPQAEKSASSLAETKAAVKKATSSIILESRPAVLCEALAKAATKTRVRKVFGKSIQVSRRERQRRKERDAEDPWMLFKDEDSRGSISSISRNSSRIMGKSMFKSLGTDGRSVSVEEYCLQWYLGKENWSGVHDEGGCVRFICSLLLWDSVLFTPVDDVFQTPYQDRPLDLFTEAFYNSRRGAIESEVQRIRSLNPAELRHCILELYTRHEMTKAVGCLWTRYSAEILSAVAAGLGGPVLAHCCLLLAKDYTYWGGGLPDLVLWKLQNCEGQEEFFARLVEVKSARDVLSEKQRAWLIELQRHGADCEVCKVVEKPTAHNEAELHHSELTSVAISAIDAAEAEGYDTN